MSVLISISQGPLSSDRLLALLSASAAHAVGATVVFEGIVRANEQGRTIRALSYEAYEPMATNSLTQLANDILSKHTLIAITVEHSRGEVAAGERSFRLAIDSAHRKEALAAMDEFIDRMKRDVPIWKTAIYI
ncbi:MAG: molybdenum cofactor biosynthesis protein MoaE [Phycisphaerae bacterium]